MSFRQLTKHTDTHFLVRYRCDNKLQIRTAGFIRSEEIAIDETYQVQWGNKGQADVAVIIAAGSEKEMRRRLSDEQGQATNQKTKAQKRKTTESNKTEDGDDSLSSLDEIDTAPSAGYNDIKKLLKQSNQRIISVRAGSWYEDHIKTVEEASKAEMDACKPEDTDMVLKSVSSICLPAQSGKSSKEPAKEQDSGKSSRQSSGKVSISECIKTPPATRESSARSKLKTPGLKNKITLLQVSTGITSIIQRKERLFRDHLLFLKSIFSVLTSLHNLKVRDIRSKVPLSREVVEKLQKENTRDEEMSRGAYASRMQFKQRGAPNYKSGLHSRCTSAVSELGDLLQDDMPPKRRTKRQNSKRDSLVPYVPSMQRSRRRSSVSYNMAGYSSRNDPFSDLEDFLQENMSPKKPLPFLPKMPRGRGNQASSMQMEGDHGDYHHPGGRMSIFNTAKRANIVDNATRNVFGRRSKTTKARPAGDSSALSNFTSLAKKMLIADQMCKRFVGNKPVRRKSKNAANITGERQALETWDDLLNVQPEPYKEDKTAGGGMSFQIGVITKFMRWYRKADESLTARVGEKRKTDECFTAREGEKRRASIIPQHGIPPSIDKNQLSQLHEIHEKGMSSDRSDKGERESVYGQPTTGSAQVTDRVKRLPIWQQVAQEKSTVFQDLTKIAPNADTAVMRSRRNLHKLKRSVQKENTATLEKIVRERVANFRLKFSALDSEECSPLFCEQKLRLQDVKDNVNKSHLENFDVQPSKWYEELKEKTISMISSYSQPDILDMLNKLQTYAHMDNKTLSYAKAKLCLLMMSLPAYDICQIYMQRALEFIFENILLGQEAQFHEWLNHRKIPYMVVSDTTASRSASPFRDCGSPSKDK